MHRTVSSILMASAVVVSAGLARADAFDTWTVQPIVQGPYGAGQYGIAYLNGKFYVPGAATTSNAASIYGSTDGATWSVATNITNGSALTALAYGNGVYFAGFANGLAYTSTDFQTWTYRNTHQNLSITGAAYGNGMWVMKRTGGVLVTTDLVTFTQVPLHNAVAASGSVIFVGKLFIAASDASGAGNIETSSDGVTWTIRYSGGGVTSLAESNGLLVGVGSRGSVVVSTDGVTWTPRTLSSPDPNPNFVNTYLRAVAPTSAGWVAVGGNMQTPLIYASTDGGRTWAPRAVPADSPVFLGLACGSGRCVAGGSRIDGKLVIDYSAGYARLPANIGPVPTPPRGTLNNVSLPKAP